MGQRRWVPVAPGHRPALDGLRAVAVAAVVVYHLAPGRLPGGFLGVDLFFVLSGYLITGLLLTAHHRDGRIDLARFWSGRARRLLPALLLVLVMVALVVRVVEPASAWSVRQADLIGGLLYSANWQLVATGRSYADAVAGASPVGHLWSLAVEEQFYLVWPLVLAGLLRWYRGRALLLGVTAALATASAVAMVLLADPDDPTRAYVGTDTRGQQVLVGAGLAILLRRAGRTPRVAGALGWGALAVGAGLLVLTSYTGAFYYRGGATLAALVAAVLIWSVEVAPRSSLARPLSWTPVVAVGTLSYGIYLWHLPVLRYLPERLPGPVATAAAVPVTLALAYASYRLVELPVRVGRLREVWWSPARVAGSAVVATAAVALLVVGSTSWATGRAAEQLAAAAAADPVTAQCPDTTSICVRVAPVAGHPTVAVVGDSVARSLDPGFVALAQARGWGYVLAAHNGCGLTGLTNVDGPAPKPFMRTCAAQTPARIATLLTTYHPDLVISLSRWELIAHLGPDGDVVAPGSARWSQDVSSGLTTFARTVTAAGARLTMLAVVPLAPADPGCVRDPGPGRCAAAPDPLTAATNRIYDQVRGTITGVAVVSMADALCPHDQCRAVVDGHLVRYDGQHFTAAGARWFVDRLASRLT